MLEKLRERALSELAQMKQVPTALAFAFGLGVVVTWVAVNWLHEERFAVMRAQLELAEKQAKPVDAPPSLAPNPAPVPPPKTVEPLADKPTGTPKQDNKSPDAKKPKDDSTGVQRPTTPPPQVLSAPNGFAIGGGTVNNPTVNNFAPKPWLLTPDQGEDLIRSLRANPLPAGQGLPMTAVMGDPDSGRLAEQLEQIIKAAGWTIKDGGISQGMFSAPVPEGIVAVVRSRESVPKPVLAIANSLLRSGFNTGPLGVQIDGGVPEGTFNLIVGRRPAR